MRSGPRNHYWRPSSMRLVDDAWHLDAGLWQRTKLLSADAGKGLAERSYGGKLSIVYRVADDALWIQHAPFEIQYAITIDSVATPFGNALYFLCPILSKGVPCRRRCRLLHMPPHEAFFGCRGCHRLTYRSSQEAGKRARAIRQAGYLSDVADILDAWL